MLDGWIQVSVRRQARSLGKLEWDKPVTPVLRKLRWADPESKPTLGNIKILLLVQKILVVFRTDCKTPSTEDVGETNREKLQGVQL